MITLALHSDYIKVHPVERAIDNAEVLNEELEHINMKEVLVVFTSIENGDNDKTINRMTELIDEHAKRVSTKNILVYPYVHLTNNPASSSLAYKYLLKIEDILKNRGYNTRHAPFGWYKGFEIKVKGHPLSELSKRLGSKDVSADSVVSQSLKAEDELKSEFYILTPEGDLIPADKFDYSNYRDLEIFKNYETRKNRVYDKEPEHIRLMKEHEIAQPEPGSDVGNLKWLPKGRLIKKLLERHVTNMCINSGAVEVETPLMYDFEHPALEKYLNRFPARQYIVLSDKKRYFLRFAACFGQFLIAHSSQISYRNLPLRMFELTRYSFRREQSGEVAGLRRLRAFTMPDMHTLTSDLDSAKREFSNQFRMCQEFMQDIKVPYVVAFRILRDWYEQNKEWYRKFAKQVGKPMLIEMFNKRYAYFITKFEFNVVDSLDKCTALSTVQIDVENAERFDIQYVDSKGEKKYPYILHASISGAIERDIYAILEKQGMVRQTGGTPMFPLWLAPTQVRIIPISEEQREYSLSLMKELSGRVRIDIDDRNESLGKRIREAEKEWVPYIVIVGKKEVETGKISLRKRGEKENISLNIEELIKEIKEKTSNYPFEELSLPKELSRRFSFI